MIWACSLCRSEAAPAEFRDAPDFGERFHFETLDPGVRVYVNEPAARAGDESRPTRLLLFALPNGNSIEQTLGCRMKPGLDWHFDIQHIAAQTRLLREITPEERIVLACIEAPGRTWSAFRGTYADGNARIGRIFDDLAERFGGPDARVTLTGHSGGGSFKFGVIESHDAIPAAIDRIVFLDSNYAYSTELHDAKLLAWLRGDAARRLIVIAYDDREITFDGKKVVGPDGGTFRATQRMVDSLGDELKITKEEAPPFTRYSGLDGRVRMFVHGNPQNKILHTALVGDMNGLVYAQTLGSDRETTWGQFGGPRAYEKWIQPEPADLSEPAADATPAPARPSYRPPPREQLPQGGAAAKDDEQSQAVPASIPSRPTDAVGGREFCRQIADLPLAEREERIFAELARGNLPDFLRRFVRIPSSGEGSDGAPLAAELEVAPDCLAVGSDADFVRMPMRPQTAQRLADRFGCILPTRKIVDAIDAAATVRLAPQPLTEDRESVAAFLLSQEKIEEDWTRRGSPPRDGLVAGAKKDIVLSNKIYDQKPNRLVIYGWRQLDGRPIQPLTNVHWDQYVDYSHGVRLVRNAVEVEGRTRPIEELLRDPRLSGLVSDEGVVANPRYPDAGD
jgi:hypothetical protein